MTRFPYALLVVVCCVRNAYALPPDESPIVLTDVSYYGDQAPDDYARERCRLDMWYPQGQTGYATVVWFHGGGLKEGDRHSGELVARRFTAAGIAVVLADYRLSPRAQCPAYIDDAAAAVAWTIRNIGRYGGDPARVFVSGHSAGGYLTAMVGLDKTYLAKHSLEPRQLAGLLPVSGQMITHSTIRTERKMPETTPLIDAWAPAYHAAKESPPCLCIVGDHDLPARMEENLYCAAAFQAAGNERFRCQVFPGRDHGTIMSRVADADDAVADAMIGFIRAHSQRPRPDSAAPVAAPR
jgi:acetyl esterase/lipase